LLFPVKVGTGEACRALAVQLRLTPPAVSISVGRGEKIAEDLKVKLIEGSDLSFNLRPE
jgi:hypothetical protein